MIWSVTFGGNLNCWTSYLAHLENQLASIRVHAQQRSVAMLMICGCSITNKMVNRGIPLELWLLRHPIKHPLYVPVNYAGTNVHGSMCKTWGSCKMLASRQTDYSWSVGGPICQHSQHFGGFCEISSGFRLNIYIISRKGGWNRKSGCRYEWKICILTQINI